MIRTHHELSPRCTIHTVEGPVTSGDIARVIAMYAHDPPELLMIWDFRQADTSPILTQDIQRLVDLVSRCTEFWEGGKIAGVFSQDVGYGLGRMFQSFAERKPISGEFQCFRDMREAQEWLGEDTR